MDPTIPAETVTPTDEEIAKKMYEDELKLTQKIESDELVARQLQAKQDARLAKQLQADDSDQGGEGQQSGPARQSKPAEGEGAGFWGWFDKVAKKSEELVDAAAKNIEEFGEKVANSDVVKSVKEGGASVIDGAKSGIDKILDSSVVQTAKEDLKQFGSKVAEVANEAKDKTSELLDDVKFAIFDQHASFGVALDKAARGNAIPLAVDAMFSRIELQGLKEKGLFTVDPDSVDKIKELRERYQAGEKVDLSLYDVHVVAALLLLWFKELPSALIAGNLTEVAGESDTLKKVVMMNTYLHNEVPRVNYNVLQRLLALLRQLDAHAEKTEMDLKKSLVIFGPYIMKSHGSPASQEILLLMATNYEDLFPDVVVVDDDAGVPDEDEYSGPAKAQADLNDLYI